MQQSVQKIAIIGNAGTGKSILACKLHEQLNLPIHHLDQYFWGPNWQHPDINEYQKIHDALCDQESWIIDGMNLRFLEYRIQKADLIIFLDFPLRLSLWRILKRTCKHYGKQAPHAAHACFEKFDIKFLKFLEWVCGFKANYRPKIMELLQQYAQTKQIYIFKSPKQVDAWLRELANN